MQDLSLYETTAHHKFIKMACEFAADYHTTSDCLQDLSPAGNIPSEIQPKWPMDLLPTITPPLIGCKIYHKLRQ